MAQERPRVRVGVVGAGFVARIHAEAYRHVRGVDVELRWVTGRRPERARAFAAEFGVAGSPTTCGGSWTTRRSTSWTCAFRTPSTPPSVSTPPGRGSTSSSRSP